MYLFNFIFISATYLKVKFNKIPGLLMNDSLEISFLLQIIIIK